MNKKILYISILLSCMKISHATELNGFDITYPKDLPGYKDEAERSIRRGIINGVSLQKTIFKTDNEKELENLSLSLINKSDFINHELGKFFLQNKNYQGYLMIQEHFYIGKENKVNINLKDVSKTEIKAISNLLQENIKKAKFNELWFSSYFVVRYVSKDNNKDNLIIENEVTKILQNYANHVVTSYMPLKSNNFYLNSFTAYGINGELLDEKALKKIKNEVKK